MQEKKESIVRMLELADEREIGIIYWFVLHLIKGESGTAGEQGASGRRIATPSCTTVRNDKVND